MELDDLRRQWQQQPADQTAPPLTDQKLQAMLANPADNPISQMTAHAKRDLRMLGVVMIINIPNLINLFSNSAKPGFGEDGSRFLLLALFAAMLVFTVWNTYARVRLLRQMQQDAPAAGLAAQLHRQTQQLVQLLQLHQRVGYAFAVALVLGVGFVLRHRLVLHPFSEAIDWSRTALAVLGVLGLGAIVMAEAARQQRRYGRHLQKLEGVLHELQR
ncbi:hypothetical protein GCM10027048_26710 [Hymenobacter coalescens]